MAGLFSLGIESLTALFFKYAGVENNNITKNNTSK